MAEVEANDKIMHAAMMLRDFLELWTPNETAEGLLCRTVRLLCFNPRGQLSTTQLFGHFPPSVGWGEEN